MTTAKDLMEFVNAWLEERDRTAILWNSLPPEDNVPFKNFLDQYRGYIVDAIRNTFSDEEIEAAIGSGKLDINFMSDED